MKIEYGTAYVVVKMKQDLNKLESLEQIGALINSVFCKNNEWLKFHKSRKRKGYTFTPLNLFDGNERGFVQEISETGRTYQFMVNSNNFELLQLIEKELSDNDIFEIVDVYIDVTEWENNIKYLNIKTPILLREFGKVTFLNRNSSETEVKDYLDILNKRIKQDYEYVTEQTLPNGYEFLKGVSKYNAVSIAYKGIKLVGTKCLLSVDDDIVSRMIAEHVVTHGIGEKSSLLGAGSVILKNF